MRLWYSVSLATWGGRSRCPLRSAVSQSFTPTSLFVDLCRVHFGLEATVHHLSSFYQNASHYRGENRAGTQGAGDSQSCIWGECSYLNFLFSLPLWHQQNQSVKRWVTVWVQTGMHAGLLIMNNYNMRVVFLLFLFSVYLQTKRQRRPALFSYITAVWAKCKPLWNVKGPKCECVPQKTGYFCGIDCMVSKYAAHISLECSWDRSKSSKLKLWMLFDKTSTKKQKLNKIYWSGDLWLVCENFKGLAACGVQVYTAEPRVDLSPFFLPIPINWRI